MKVGSIGVTAEGQSGINYRSAWRPNFGPWAIADTRRIAKIATQYTGQNYEEKGCRSSDARGR